MTDFVSVLVLLSACSRIGEVCPVDAAGAGALTLGDANGDGHVDLSDGTYAVLHAFHGRPPVACDAAFDVVPDGQVEPADSYGLWSHLFEGTGLGTLEAGACSTSQGPEGGICGRLVYGLDAPDEVEGQASFEARAWLQNRDLDPGPEAWSLGIEAEGCTIAAVTTEGTVAGLSIGSDLGRRRTGYEVSRVTDGGAVSAVVLDYRLLSGLDAGKDPIDLLVLTVTAEAPASECGTCVLRFSDSLAADGEPVASIVARQGRRYVPGREEASVEVCAP